MSDYLISVKPKWANAFFDSKNPKSIELRKGSFGASLKSGDSLVVYSTMPQGRAIGTVKFFVRETLPLFALWHRSKQGEWAYVSQKDFEAYYANQEFGVAVWVGEPNKWERPIALAELRKILGDHWQPPQQIAKVDINFLIQNRSVPNA